MRNTTEWEDPRTFSCLDMIGQMTTTDPLARRGRLRWEQLEWRAWPDSRTDQIIQTMGQALTRSIEAN